MSLFVTKCLKEKFRNFCNDEFPEKLTCLNLYDNKKWFFVYAGEFHSWYIHYEYLDGYVHLHSEFEDTDLANVFETFINAKLAGNENFSKSEKFGKIIQWTYNKVINTEKELWDAFIYIRNSFDSIIKLFETGK